MRRMLPPQDSLLAKYLLYMGRVVVCLTQVVLLRHQVAGQVGLLQHKWLLLEQD